MKKMSLVSLLLLLQLPEQVLAQGMAVPVDVQFALFDKILSFDRNLKTRAGEQIVMGVIYQKKIKASAKAKEDVEAVMPLLQQINDIPVRYVMLDLDDVKDLDEAITKTNATVFYVTPLNHVEMNAIVRISRSKQILTLTGVRDYVALGLAVGIDVKDGNPLPFINLPAAKAEGADFNAKLLKLSRVIE